MTEEEKIEKAKEYSIKITPFLLKMIAHKTKDTYSEEQLQEGYLAGYEQGFAEGRKEKWHDLREDPNDLPKESGEYWCKWEDGTYCTAHYFEVGGFCDCTIAWCELPKFKD